MLNYGMGWGFGRLGWFAIALSWLVPILVGVAAVEYLLVSGGRRVERTGPPAPNGALKILEERYARGEINREELEEKRADLIWR